jgi:hypothetical protein
VAVDDEAAFVQQQSTDTCICNSSSNALNADTFSNQPVCAVVRLVTTNHGIADKRHVIVRRPIGHNSFEGSPTLNEPFVVRCRTTRGGQNATTQAPKPPQRHDLIGSKAEEDHIDDREQHGKAA